MARISIAGAARLLVPLGLVAGLFLTSGRAAPPGWGSVASWLGVALAAELLWHAGRREGTVISMAPAAYLGALAVLPWPWGVAVALVSAAGGSALWHRRGAHGVLVYAGGIGVGAVVASSLLAAFRVSFAGGAQHGPAVMPQALEPLVLFLAGAALQAASQAADAVLVSRRLRISTWRAWRESFGYGTEAVTAVALIVVGMLAVFCYEALGLRGVLLCVMPLLFVRDGSRRYLDLQRAQSRILRMERLAAKGEMAAEIGHELNNYLAAISGRAQLLAMGERALQDERLGEDAEGIRTLAVRMSGLAKGLMDFSHRDTLRTRFAMNELVERTVELVRPQARFRDVDFRLESDPALPEVVIDPGQMQQVLFLLLRRAVSRDRDRAVRIVTRPEGRGRVVALEILPGEATGMERGVPAPPAPAPGGDEDAELGTVLRILQRHQGQFETRREEGAGTAYRLVLPAA